ncbi:hypothetical protein HAX54_021443, partial [Datura stramonium]|nr:hypothetical protein [Datura stramonium]
MAREIQRGVNSVNGVEAALWQEYGLDQRALQHSIFGFSFKVPETLPERILEKMKAPKKPDDVPEIRPEQLLEADGFIFGFPSRFRPLKRAGKPAESSDAGFHE